VKWPSHWPRRSCAQASYQGICQTSRASEASQSRGQRSLSHLGPAQRPPPTANRRARLGERWLRSSGSESVINLDPAWEPNRRLKALCCWVKVAGCRLPCYAAPLGARRCGPACQALRTVRSGWVRSASAAAVHFGDRSRTDSKAVTTGGWPLRAAIVRAVLFDGRELLLVGGLALLAGGDCWPSTAIRGASRGSTFSIIRLVPVISAVALLTFALHG
jgi:hypothetical protein